MKTPAQLRTPAAALFVLAAATGAQAQPATAPATQPAFASTQPAATTQPGAPEATGGGVILPGGKVLLNFRNASLDSVLSFLSEAGGLTVINDVKLEGRVNVLNRQPLTIEEALDVLKSALLARTRPVGGETCCCSGY